MKFSPVTTIGPSAHMCQWTTGGSSLVQVMAWCRIGAKPIPEPMHADILLTGQLESNIWFMFQTPLNNFHYVFLFSAEQRLTERGKENRSPQSGRIGIYYAYSHWDTAKERPEILKPRHGKYLHLLYINISAPSKTTHLYSMCIAKWYHLSGHKVVERRMTYRHRLNCPFIQMTSVH